jgi:Leucine-rich repeat (LRR) protein
MQELPSDVSCLSHVTSLDLNSQDLTGPIPSSWSTLPPTLTRLDLSFNRLEGPLPAKLLTLPELYVCHNRLRLPTDADLESACLHDLTTLDLHNMGLVGELPEGLCTHLPGLTRLDLSGRNVLEGPLPASLLLAIETRGIELRLQGENRLTLPNDALHSIGSGLRKLSLPHSGLHGPLPRSLTCLTTLETLDLSHNSLEVQPTPPKLYLTRVFSSMLQRMREPFQKHAPDAMYDS